MLEALDSARAGVTALAFAITKLTIFKAIDKILPVGFVSREQGKSAHPRGGIPVPRWSPNLILPVTAAPPAHWQEARGQGRRKLFVWLHSKLPLRSMLRMPALSERKVTTEFAVRTATVTANFAEKRPSAPNRDRQFRPRA